MTAAGLTATLLVGVLLVARELVQTTAPSSRLARSQALDHILPPLLLAWLVLTVVRVASYL